MFSATFDGAGSAAKFSSPRVPKKPRVPRDGILQAEIVAALVREIPGMETTRWRERVLGSFCGTPDVEHVEDDFRDYIAGFRYIPDAYVINLDEMRLDFFEVEITSLMTDTKLQAYGEFTTIMDYYGIEFSLFSVNQHGHINHVPLLAHYLRWIKAQAARD